ncbi:hypothetical protein IC627_09500 [Photobacterium damselae subsp. piscicida]|uniref:Uncharacterized protein n=1 Tax=Photobacterium damsela subsp. piscicida TaxID=38294 RepID=A0A7L8A0G4_PHODP|nr:hypothetical protein [Photobacterium damselae]QOD55578.1 hypothetical protein IC627_09500 [Photobacterium damselae subsp. piscicida]
MYDIQKRILNAVQSVKCNENDSVLSFSKTKLLCFKSFLLKNQIVFKRNHGLCIYEKHYKEIMLKINRHYEKAVLENRHASSTEFHLQLLLDSLSSYLKHVENNNDVFDSYVLLKCSKIRNAKLLSRIDNEKLLKYENGNAYINVVFLEKLYRKYKNDENFKRYFLRK